MAGMPKKPRTLYEVLGVKPDVKHHELTFLYDRQMAARRREDAPPDQKAETAMRAAFDVLSDPDRREAYDRELAAARIKPSFGPAQGAMAAGFVLVVAAGIAFFVMKKPAESVGATAPALENISANATTAVGRLQSTDMSGQSKAAGLAFAIDEGVMVASCEHITANTQLIVNVVARMAPARLASTNEALGLCKLDVKGTGSWPLRVASAETRAGDVVYATHVNAVGEVSLKETRVKAVRDDQGARVVDTTTVPAVGGAPLLDTQGRVVAVASHSRHVMLPKSWTDAPMGENQRSPSTATPSPADEAAPGATAGSAAYDRGVDPTAPKSRVVLPPNSPISQDDAQRLHKQYRPERKIPADQDP